MSTFAEKLGMTSKSPYFSLLKPISYTIDVEKRAKLFYEAGDKYASSKEETLAFLTKTKETDRLFNNKIQSVHIVLYTDDKVLLIKNKYTKKWQIPGGKKDNINETDE